MKNMSNFFNDLISQKKGESFVFSLLCRAMHPQSTLADVAFFAREISACVADEEWWCVLFDRVREAVYKVGCELSKDYFENNVDGVFDRDAIAITKKICKKYKIPIDKAEIPC